MKEQLLSTLETSRAYTLAVAESMPEGSYKVKPEGGGWNFMELMHHIAYGIEWWTEYYIKGNEISWEQPALKPNKKDIITYLNNSYNLLKSEVEKQNPTDGVIKGFNATLDHTTHHRGQAVVYLRCRGINPPEYVY